MVTKARLLGIALGAFLMLSGASVTYAHSSGRRCEEKIEHEQRELNKAIARHGYRSKQAEKERRDLDRLYDRCGYYRRYRGDGGRDNWRHYDRDRDRGFFYRDPY